MKVTLWYDEVFPVMHFSDQDGAPFPGETVVDVPEATLGRWEDARNRYTQMQDEIAAYIQYGAATRARPTGEEELT